MKTVMQLLSLLLCFEFIVAPVQGSLLINSAQAEDAKTCPAGQQYESSVNRCLTKVEVLKVNEATQNCGTDKNCYADNASAALAAQDTGSTKNVLDTGVGKALNIAAVAIPLVIVTNVLLEKRESRNGSKFSCKPASLILMYGAAASLAVGEIYGYFTHKAKLKKIQDQWDAAVVPKDESGTDKKRTEATEAQSQAFEFLAQNEEQVGKTAKTKKGFYLAATGLFAAGAAMAAVESFQLSSAKLALPKAKAKAANPETAAAGLAEVEKHENTIMKLSCFTDKVGKESVAQSAKENAEKEKTESANTAAKQAAEAAAKSNVAQEAQSAKNASDLRAAEEQYTKSNPESEKTKELKAKWAAEDEANLKRQEDKNNNIELLENIDKLKKPSTYPTTPTASPIKIKGTFWTPKKDIEKLKRVAAYNLSTAKDADQFVNLMREFEALEFENYSQIRYEESDSTLKNATFSPVIAKLMAEALMPEAQAGLFDGAISSAGSSMLLPMLNKIPKIFTFNDGKPMKAGEMNEITSKSKSLITKAIGKPTTRLAINGVLGTWMGIATINLNKQQKLAQERAKKLRSMKEDFVTASGLLYCTEADRADTTKPKCYCYTADNKVNPARSSSDYCKNTIATMNAATDSNADEAVCVTSNMAMDTSCACRSTNTCLKTTAGFTSMGFSPATFKMISANAAPANDLFSGVATGGDIAEAAGINAARTQAAAASTLANDPVAAKEVKNAADTFSKGLLAATSGLSMGSNASNSPLPTTPAGAAAALDKEIKKSNEDIDVTNSGTSSSPSTSFDSTEQVPEFGMSSADAAHQEIEIAEVMGKEVDFGSNDITKTKDTNLFEVLSNRYQRSGMKRLFEEGKSAPADAPAKTDISN